MANRRNAAERRPFDTQSQIKNTQKRIAHSATYHALLSEQAAKGNTESAALLKTLQSAPAL